MLRRDHVKPLQEFSPDHRARIERQVADDRPPSRYIGLGEMAYGRPMALIESRAWWEWHWARGIDPDKRREPIPPHLRQRVIARDGYVCQLCGTDVEPTDVHLDHIKPFSLGGPTTLANLQVTHSLCNIRKGARV